MNEVFENSMFFGMALTIFAYWLAVKLRKRFDNTILNPLLISGLIIIITLLVFRIDYETYAYGARTISNLLTPATVCLAVPLYRQIQVLRKNFAAVMIGIICGCGAHAAVMLAAAGFAVLRRELLVSLLSKSVTTSIALGVTEEIGGITAVTILGVMVAGLFGAILGPRLFVLFKVEEPVSQGLAMGTASHAVGTSKAMEMGDIQGAMSSLAIVVTGLLTVILAPIIYQYV